MYANMIYAGHNRLVTYTPVAVAVLRAFNGALG